MPARGNAEHFASLMLPACANDADLNPASESVGSVGLELDVGGILVQTVSYQITGNGVNRSGTLSVGKSATISTVLGELAPGTGYSITITASDPSVSGLACTGTATFNVTAGKTTSVSVHLVCSVPPKTGSVAVSADTNVCPTIASLTAATSEVYVGGSIELAVKGSDIDNRPSLMAYSWSATNGWTATGANVTFPCSRVGTYTLTVAVSDGDAACSTLTAAALTRTIDVTCSQLAPANFIQFVYSSDAHYGITRAAFRGGAKVDAHPVNAALVGQINALATAVLPNDGGLRAGQVVGAVDYVIETGDIANREEGTGIAAIQSAAASWAQFKTDYISGLTLKDHYGQVASLLLAPGNHDVSNAIGFYKTMTPATDATSMAEIYNYMLKPVVPLTKDTYSYATNRVHYSRDMSGIHFAFVNMWPDSGERAWLASDLASVSAATPVIIFTHDQPDVEAKHLTNPNGDHGINATDKFENLLVDMLADGTTTAAPSTLEQQAFVDFVKAHTNIVAYFHGNSNKNEFYDYVGPAADIALPTFRVDSPMKGDISSTDETKLSFQVAVLDPIGKAMTVRECLWNTVTDPNVTTVPLVWGASRTISIATH